MPCHTCIKIFRLFTDVTIYPRWVWWSANCCLCTYMHVYLASANKMNKVAWNWMCVAMQMLDTGSCASIDLFYFKHTVDFLIPHFASVCIWFCHVKSFSWVFFRVSAWFTCYVIAFSLQWINYITAQPMGNFRYNGFSPSVAGRWRSMPVPANAFCRSRK